MSDEQWDAVVAYLLMGMAGGALLSVISAIGWAYLLHHLFLW